MISSGKGINSFSKVGGGGDNLIQQNNRAGVAWVGERGPCPSPMVGTF